MKEESAAWLLGLRHNPHYALFYYCLWVCHHSKMKSFCQWNICDISMATLRHLTFRLFLRLIYLWDSRWNQSCCSSSDFDVHEGAQVWELLGPDWRPTLHHRLGSRLRSPSVFWTSLEEVLFYESHICPCSFCALAHEWSMRAFFSSLSA